MLGCVSMTQIAPQITPTEAPAGTDAREAIIPRAPDIGGSNNNNAAPTENASTSLDADVSVNAGFDGFSFNIFSGEFWSGLFGGEFWSFLWFLGGVGAVLAWLWSFYTFLAYLFSLIFIVMYIYATIRLEYYSGLIAQRLRDEEKQWNELYSADVFPSRLDDVLKHADSDRPNDWKLAIIEADIVLDQVLKERGYAGNSLGERLRSITPNQLSSIDDAWEAHMVRNKIAHEGADFVLTKRIADHTIQQYRRVFADLGVT